MLDADADQFNLEFANREFKQIELLERFRPGQRIGVGVIDVKSYFVETPEQVEALKLETQYFVDCIAKHQTPFNDGHSGLRVVQLLEAVDRSLKRTGDTVYV